MKMNRKCFIWQALIFGLMFSHGLLALDFKVAVRAHKGIEKAITLWQPTMEALGSQLPPHTFTLVPILSLDEITAATGRGEFDFVLTNPSSYVEIEKLHGARALVTLNNKRANTAQNAFGSVIFTHVKNINIRRIEDLKNKKLMVVSKSAFGGWRVAWLEMLEQGFDPMKRLQSLSFSPGKTQQEVVYAVLDGRVDAGVVRTDLLERMEVAGEIDLRYLRILNNKSIQNFPFFLSTKLYPEWAFAVMTSVPEKISQQVKNVLLAISRESNAAQKGNYVGWVPAADYNSVEQLMRRLKVGPYTQ